MKNVHKHKTDKVIKELQNGIKYKKCWICGCQQGTVLSIEKQLHNINKKDAEQLEPVLARAKKTFQSIQYDCLGCKICYPSEALNALMELYPHLEIESDECAEKNMHNKENTSWPILPGNYKVIRYQAPVAVCTLNSKDLIDKIAQLKPFPVSIVGSLNTENLGIERLIQNVITNPNIRFLIICGEDTKQKIGHLPGQSLISLFKNGLDAHQRIIGALGKRAQIKNITPDYVNHFRKQIKVVDMIGCMDSTNLIRLANDCAQENPGIFQKKSPMKANVRRITAHPTKPLVLDPKGYFVIFPDAIHNCIVVEHYHNTGTLNCIITAEDVTHIYMTIIDSGLISRLDHACYLGRELTRAEQSLKSGKPYQQDRAPDKPEDSKNVKSCCQTPSLEESL